MTSTTKSRRILLVDDNAAIHEDFRKVLAVREPHDAAFDELEQALFDQAPASTKQLEFELVSAYQGQEAYEHTLAAVAAGTPFALAFVDMRMPPGWDGLETIEKLWSVDPELQIVICSAYSDHSWRDLRDRLGDRDGLLVLKKPFDTIEVVQCAHALTAKWTLARERRGHLASLEERVVKRTEELQAVNERLSAELVHRDRMEAELRLAHRLEAMGQLAAGIAHEINTPIQYVGNNLELLRTSTTDLLALCSELRGMIGDVRPSAIADRMTAAIQRADLPYLTELIPEALGTIDQGVGRVTSIVRAMKELAHPGGRTTVLTDLNRALRNALEVTASQYRYVADVESVLTELPAVLCHPGELNQVFINLIVNAAQAMEDTDRRQRGTLRVSSRVEGEDVVVAISDTGCGIPEPNQSHVFDAFFTTKELGRGTGQGLAISRAIVVERHGGSLTFESKVGVGTTFYVRIPIGGATPAASA